MEAPPHHGSIDPVHSRLLDSLFVAGERADRGHRGGDSCVVPNVARAKGGSCPTTARDASFGASNLGSFLLVSPRVL